MHFNSAVTVCVQKSGHSPCRDWIGAERSPSDRRV